jgi:hypothetical protein
VTSNSARCRANGHTGDWHQKDEPEESAPESAPGRARSSHAETLFELDLAALVPGDDGIVDLDELLLLQALEFSPGGSCGFRIFVCNGNQCAHVRSSSNERASWKTRRALCAESPAAPAIFKPRNFSLTLASMLQGQPKDPQADPPFFYESEFDKLICLEWSLVSPLCIYLSQHIESVFIAQ